HRSVALHVYLSQPYRALPSFPTRRSSDLAFERFQQMQDDSRAGGSHRVAEGDGAAVHVQPLEVQLAHGAVEAELLAAVLVVLPRSEEHTSELQSRVDLVCRLLLEKKSRTA